MIKKFDRDAMLLAESFHDDWATGSASGFARAAAASARRRKALRQFLGASAAAIATAAFALIITRHQAPPPTQQAAVRGYEIISDDELLAQLHDRPILVVKRPDGSRQITLLEN